MLSKKQKAYMNVARYLASKSDLRHKHGAVVVKSGRILGTGYNKYRNHPNIIPEGKHKEQCSQHAEAVAIKEAGQHARGATIFVARINRQGGDLLSKPCNLCQELIDRTGVKTVVYTRSNP
jgi:deoxycytidylate deaminase